MPDYSKSVIYTIRSKDNIYVGSTCNFKGRKSQHKRNIYKENSERYNMKIYKTIRDNGGQWDMKPYKEFPCESKLQLSIEEERVRVELNADMNSCPCYTDRKLYYENNKEEICKAVKEYRKNNKEKLCKKAREKYQNNKEEITKKAREKYREKKNNL